MTFNQTPEEFQQAMRRFMMVLSLSKGIDDEKAPTPASVERANGLNDIMIEATELSERSLKELPGAVAELSTHLKSLELRYSALPRPSGLLNYEDMIPSEKIRNLMKLESSPDLKTFNLLQSVHGIIDELTAETPSQSPHRRLLKDTVADLLEAQYFKGQAAGFLNASRYVRSEEETSEIAKQAVNSITQMSQALSRQGQRKVL